MKKRILLAFSIFAAFLAISGGIADAATTKHNRRFVSCNVASTGTIYNPTAGWNIQYNINFTSCVNVSQVQVFNGAGWFDNSTGGQFAGNGYGTSTVVNGAASFLITRWCWYVGAVHVINNQYTYRLKSGGGVWQGNVGRAENGGAFAC